MEHVQVFDSVGQRMLTTLTLQSGTMKVLAGGEKG